MRKVSRIVVAIIFFLSAGFTLSAAAVDLTTGLVASYNFEGNANDMTGNGNNGTASGGVSYVDGLHGKAAKFGGYYNPGHIRIPESSSLQFGTEMTISTWVRLDSGDGMDAWHQFSSTNAGGAIFAKSHDSTGFVSLLNYNQGVMHNWFCNNMTSSPTFAVGANQTSSLGFWHHYCVVVSNSTAMIFIDGALIGTTNDITVNFAAANAQDLYIGKYSDSWYPLDGAVDDFRIYNRALTEIEIKALAEKVLVDSGGPRIAQTPMAGPPGTAFAEWGTGFTPNGTVTLHFFNPAKEEILPAVSLTLDAIGHFDITYQAPQDKAPGSYTWWAVDNASGQQSNQVTYEITAPAGQRGLYFSPDTVDYGIGVPGVSTLRTMTLFNDSNTEVQVEPLTLEVTGASTGLISFDYTVENQKPVAPFKIPPHGRVSVQVTLGFSGTPAGGAYDAVLKAKESGGAAQVASAYLSARQGGAVTLEVTRIRGGNLISSIKSGGAPQQGYYTAQGSKITEPMINALPMCYIPPVGVVADGNSRLLVVAQTNVEGLVRFENPEPAVQAEDQGKNYFLESLDHGSGGNQVDVPTVKIKDGVYQATAVLIAPEDFPNSEQQTVGVTLYTTASGGVPVAAASPPITVKVKRAPVVLIHGLWADPGSWYKKDHPEKGGVKIELENGGYTVGMDQYDGTQGPSETMTKGESRLRKIITGLCLKEINNRFECTRADLVGHSMGGLVAREFIAENTNYKTNADYNQGSVRRLLTIATPHSGSGFANFLMGDNANIEECITTSGRTTWLNLITLINLTPFKLFYWDGLTPHFYSAIHDLELGDENKLLSGLNASAQDIPTFAIIGDTEIQLPDFGAILNKTGCSHHEIFHGENSDRIVPVSSAEGGLAFSHRETIPGIWHVGMGMNSEIAKKVKDKLDGPVTAFAQQIHPEFAAGSSANKAMAKALAIPSPLSMLKPSAKAAAGLLTLNANATTLAPGADLILTAIHGGTLVETMVLTDEKGNTLSADAAPWVWTIPIPVSAAGGHTYKVVAVIDGEVAESNSVEITTLPEMAGLQALNFQPGEQTMLIQGTEEQLVLLGTFADGQTRDLTGQAMGTTYHERIVNGVEVSEGDSTAIEVSADGKVSALQPGTADVVGVNGSITTVRRFVVMERPPTVAEARDDAATTYENHPVTIDVLANDIGEGALAVVTVGTPEHGSATIDGSVVTYTPLSGWSGTETIVYTLKDNIGGTATGSITVTVTPTALTTTTTEASTTTGTSSTTTTIQGNSGVTLQVSTGWGLLSSTIGFQAATVFGDGAKYTSVWKWVNGTWAVYLPSELNPGSYATSKGFSQISTINPGEGFWVNATGLSSLTIPGTPVSGELSFTNGWNLVGLKSAASSTVADFITNKSGIVSIWKWESWTWAVYLPEEGDKGAGYASSKGFGHMATINPGEGFWVNVPAAPVTTTTTAVAPPTTTTMAPSTTTTTTPLPSTLPTLPTAVGNYSVSSAFTESCWTGVATQNYTLSIANQQPDGTFTTSDLPGLSSSNSKVTATEVTGKMTSDGTFSGSFKIYGGTGNGVQSGSGSFDGTLSGNNIAIHAIGLFNGVCHIDGTVSGSK